MRSIRTGASDIPENNVLQLTTDLITQSGIVNPPGGGFAVALNSNLSVEVAAGRAYLIASGGNCYPIISDANASVSVNTNSSGNPRISSIVLYENLSNTPGTDGSNTATLFSVDGTPAASPTAPSNSTIQTAIGAGNPFTVLANVEVPSGASDLATQGTLTDERVSVGFNPAMSLDEAVYASTITFDISIQKVHFIQQLTGNPTFAVVNCPVGQAFVIRFTEDSTGGRTPSWFNTINWGDYQPTTTFLANKSYLYGFLCTAPEVYDGIVINENI